MAVLEAKKTAHSATRMPCMEVCGGNGDVEKHFTMPGLDTWVFSQPQGNSAVDGGDIHFLSSCASGRITRMLLADICAPGAVFVDLSSQLRDLMLHNVNTITQTRFVREMHAELHRYADQGAYAAAQISTFFAPTRSFSLCNAGYPTPLVYRSSTRSWTLLKPSACDAPTSDADNASGVLDENEYQQFTIRLDSGDMVLNYGNSLAECRPNNAPTLGVTGLLNTLEQLGSSDPDAIVSSLASLLTDHGNQSANLADTTFMLCRATDRGVRWKDNLLAPFRLLGRASDRTYLR